MIHKSNQPLLHLMITTTDHYHHVGESSPQVGGSLAAGWVDRDLAEQWFRRIHCTYWLTIIITWVVPK